MQFYLSKKLLKLIICDWNTERLKRSSKFTLSDGLCVLCIKSLESLVIKKQNMNLDNAMQWMIQGLFGVWNFRFQDFFWVGKFGKYFFVWPDLSRDFLGYTKQSEDSL